MRRVPLPPEALDPVDRQILNALQDGFPIGEHPFAKAGAALNQIGRASCRERV